MWVEMVDYSEGCWGFMGAIGEEIILSGRRRVARTGFMWKLDMIILIIFWVFSRVGAEKINISKFCENW